MSDEHAVFHPGEVVQDSGIYECDCGQAHEYSTDERGHPFPPLRPNCTGSGWRLKQSPHTR